MRAAYYERTGPAGEVLEVGELPTPVAGAGEVRVRVAWSGVNPSDVKSRAGTRTKSLPFPRIVPHSDGAGLIDAVGEGVERDGSVSAYGSGTRPGAAHTAPPRNTWLFRRSRPCRCRTASTSKSAPAWAFPR